MESFDVQSLLDALSPSVGALARRGDVRRYRKNMQILQEGDAGGPLYILLAGAVRAFACGLDDQELTFSIDRAGDYFGEMSLDGGPRSVSVVAIEPTICSVVTRETVLRQMGEDPQLASELLQRVIARARFATESARRLALLDVYGRMTRLLNELARDDASGRRVLERMTHKEIASRVGSSREMISRLMKDLVRGGYVEVDSTQLALLRPLPRRW